MNWTRPAGAALALVVLASAPWQVTAQQPRALAAAAGREDPAPHAAWVERALRRMQTVRPGMTRADLFTLFTIEGGLSTGLRRTYVYRDCPTFKVDVDFKPEGRPERDAEGRVTLVEDPRDVIMRMSKPYLDGSTLD